MKLWSSLLFQFYLGSHWESGGLGILFGKDRGYLISVGEVSRMKHTLSQDYSIVAGFRLETPLDLTVVWVIITYAMLF